VVVCPTSRLDVDALPDLFVIRSALVSLHEQPHHISPNWHAWLQDSNEASSNVTAFLDNPPKLLTKDGLNDKLSSRGKNQDACIPSLGLHGLLAICHMSSSYAKGAIMQLGHNGKPTPSPSFCTRACGY